MKGLSSRAILWCMLAGALAGAYLPVVSRRLSRTSVSHESILATTVSAAYGALVAWAVASLISCVRRDRE